MSGLFFTGTDTGVGKTFVVAAVTRALRRAGHSVQALKPVASGASDDTRLLCEAMGLPTGHGHEATITPWRFAAEAAPAVAARLEGKQLELDKIVAAIHQQKRAERVLLVEGVGGLLCPLTQSSTVADLIAKLGLPMVVVARRSLGTLNHTLLTLEVSRMRGLRVAGVVVSETEPVDGVAAQTNVDELRRLNVPVLAVVPHTREPSVAVESLAAVDWVQRARNGVCKL